MIRYKEGYKYLLVEKYKVKIDIFPLVAITTKYIELDMFGVLTINAGYAWDGPSGPTIDTKNFIRGSLVHDALYQLMRENHLDKVWFNKANDILYQICIEDGMSWFRARYVKLAVDLFGYDAMINADTAIITAP